MEGKTGISKSLPLTYPLRVTREDLDIFEERTGFHGWGDEMIRDGLIEIVPMD